MAGRPRDERGRFISRAAAEAKGISWPSGGSGTSAASSVSRAPLSSSSYTAPVAYYPSNSTPVQSSVSSYAAARPRDDRGRFISRTTAEAQGISWPSTGSVTASSAPKVAPAKPPAPIAVQALTPNPVASRPRDEKGRFISRATAEEQGVPWPSSGSVATSSASKTASAKAAPVAVQTYSPNPAADRPRDEKGRFISRKTAEEQGIPFPSTAATPRDEKGRFSSASAVDVTQAKDIYSTPPATKTRSAAAKERPRDSKGRFVKLTGETTNESEATNRRPRDAKGRFVKRLVLSPTSADSDSPLPKSETVSEATNRRPRPRDSKGRFVKLTDKEAQSLSNNPDDNSSAQGKKKATASTDRPRDAKGRFIKRQANPETEEEPNSSANTTKPTKKAVTAKSKDRPRDAKGRFVKTLDITPLANDEQSEEESSTHSSTDRFGQLPSATWLDDEADDYDADFTNYGVDSEYPVQTNYQYPHSPELVNNVETQLPEQNSGRYTPVSESAESSSSDTRTDVTYIEDRGTQTDKWIQLNEHQTLLLQGNAMCRRIITNPAINEIIRDRDPQILIDLCALFFS